MRIWGPVGRLRVDTIQSQVTLAPGRRILRLQRAQRHSTVPEIRIKLSFRGGRLRAYQHPACIHGPKEGLSRFSSTTEALLQVSPTKVETCPESDREECLRLELGRSN